MGWHSASPFCDVQSFIDAFDGTVVYAEREQPPSWPSLKEYLKKLRAADKKSKR